MDRRVLGWVIDERKTQVRASLCLVVVCCGLLWLACSRPDPPKAAQRATETPGRAKALSPTQQHAVQPQPPHVTKSLELLNAVGRNSANAIPEAILSHTKCVAVVPAAHGQRPHQSTGMMSCREGNEDNWDNPVTVHYSSAKRRGQRTNLIIMLLTDSAVNAVRRGQLPLRSPSQTAPGILLHNVGLATRGELHSDTVAYTASNAVLKGVKLDGALSVPPAQKSSASDHNSRVAANERSLRTLRSFFNTIVPTGIIIHHTATLPTTEKVPANRRDIDIYHAARGFAIECFGREYHVAYHYLILPNGKIQEGRPERCEGAHAIGYNSYLGISVAGDFSSKDNPKGEKGLAAPTPKQITSLIQLCERLQKKYHIPVQHILRHTDVSSTDCPGDRFPFTAVLRKVASSAAPPTTLSRK